MITELIAAAEELLSTHASTIEKLVELAPRLEAAVVKAEELVKTEVEKTVHGVEADVQAAEQPDTTDPAPQQEATPPAPAATESAPEPTPPQPWTPPAA